MVAQKPENFLKVKVSKSDHNGYKDSDLYKTPSISSHGMSFHKTSMNGQTLILQTQRECSDTG